MIAGPAAMRLDKWLWQARFFKSRALATRAVQEGRVRINGARVLKPAAPVGPGDGLTMVIGGVVRVVRIRGLGARRGPAAEARLLYDELGPPGGGAGPGGP